MSEKYPMNQAALERMFAPPPAPVVSPGEATAVASAPVPTPAPGQFVMLPIGSIEDFQGQPFHLYSDEEIQPLKQSIGNAGILQPLIVRPLGVGKYQTIIGRNRRRAAQMLGMESVPCIVRELTDDVALVQLIDDNLNHRPEVRPSEKAWAYRLRLEAMNRQGERTDLTSRQVGGRLESADELGESTGESGRQIQRYIRLTYLIPPLLELVDRAAIGLTVGGALSYLSAESQVCIHQFFVLDHPRQIDQYLVDRLRGLEADPLTEPDLLPFLSPVIVKPFRKVTVHMNQISRFFKPEATPKEIEKTIFAALAAFFKGEKDEHE